MLIGINEFEQAAINRLMHKRDLSESPVIFVGFNAKYEEVHRELKKNTTARVHFLYSGSSEVSNKLQKEFPKASYSWDKEYCVREVVNYQLFWINKICPMGRVVSWGNGRIARQLADHNVGIPTISVREYKETGELPDGIFEVVILNSQEPLPLPLLKGAKLVINTARTGNISIESVMELVNRGCYYITDVDNWTLESDYFIQTPHIAYLSFNSMLALISNAYNIAKEVE